MNHEGVEREGVAVHHDTTDIADNLRQATHEHTGHETPGLPSEAKVGMGETDNSEQSDKGNVGSQIRSVAEETPLDLAVVECAGRVGAEVVLGRDGVVVVGHVGGLVLMSREWALVYISPQQRGFERAGRR